jgi:hypothetical protein
MEASTEARFRGEGRGEVPLGEGGLYGDDIRLALTAGLEAEGPEAATVTLRK